MNEKKSRKEWIKSFAIVFLAVLLVLTFFSNTIRNYSLPEVSAQYTYSGSITNKVRGQGIVSATDPYSVVYKQSRKIDSVAVRVGDEVEKGDVIYYLEGGESEELKAAIETLESLQAAYDRKLLTDQISTSVSSAVEKGQTADTASIQAKITTLKKRIENLEKEVANYDSQIEAWTTGDPNAITERKNLEDLKKTEEAWNTQYSISQINLSEIKKKVPDYDALTTRISTEKTDMETAQGVVTTKKGIVATKEAQLATDPANGTYQSELDAANKALETATNDYNSKKQIYDDDVALKNLYDQRVNENNTADYYSSISPLNTKAAQKVVDDKVEELRNARSASNTNLTKAQQDLTDYVSTISTQLDLGDSLKAIQKQQEVVDKLRGEQGGGEITAPVSGTIMSLNRVAGETIENGETVASIQMAGKGFSLTMSVTNEQATLLHVGDEAEVTNSWWYSDIHARIASIRPDTANRQGGKIVTFEIEGDVSDGQTLSISAGKRTSNYDIIVPNSAIKEDNKGKFVYRVVSKNTPLGTRYSVERIDIKVLAEDDTQSAISGALESWEYIVTTSAKPLTDGQLVRLKD